VIRAPYSGYVTKRYVHVGESVQAGQPLIAGVSLGELRVNVNVPQSAVEAIARELKWSHPELSKPSDPPAFAGWPV